LSTQLKNLVFKCAWNNKKYRAKCDGCPDINLTCRKGKDRKGGIHVHPEEPESCWEMNLFNRLEFGSGDNVSIRQSGPNKIVIFTTKKPNMNHRSIIGITRINEIRKNITGTCSHGEYRYDLVIGDRDSFVEIPQEIDINYNDWDKRPWRRMLFRYLSDDDVKNILLKIKFEFKQREINSDVEEKLEKLIHLIS
jgi:hypothetical protein